MGCTELNRIVFFSVLICSRCHVLLSVSSQSCWDGDGSVQRHAPSVVEIGCMYTQVAPVVARQFLSCFVLFAGSVASETSEAAVTEPDGKLQCLLLLSAMYTKHHTLDSWWLTYNAHHIEVTIEKVI